VRWGRGPVARPESAQVDEAGSRKFSEENYPRHEGTTRNAVQQQRNIIRERSDNEGPSPSFGCYKTGAGLFVESDCNCRYKRSIPTRSQNMSR